MKTEEKEHECIIHINSQGGLVESRGQNWLGLMSGNKQIDGWMAFGEKTGRLCQKTVLTGNNGGKEDIKMDEW